MVAFVDQGAVTQTASAEDSASTAAGVALLCGARVFAISPTTLPYLSLSSAVLTLQSTDPA